MERWKSAGYVAALIAAGVLGAALPGSAQKGNKGKVDSTVGFVDLAQITEQIKETADWKLMVKKFEDDRAKYRNEIEDLAKIRFLSPAERQELTNLRAKQKPSDGEKNRIAELETRSGKLDQEYQSLAMVEKPTEQQKARLTELTQLREKASTAIQDDYDQRAQKLQETEGKMLDEMQNRILKIVSEVAEKQGLTMVVDRQAILYGGQDMTPEVVKKLPK